jgi:hypothetical protein
MYISKFYMFTLPLLTERSGSRWLTCITWLIENRAMGMKQLALAEQLPFSKHTKPLAYSDCLLSNCV